MRILLIEPDITLGGIYFGALEQAGHAVRWERTGQSAMHAIDSERPDIVVLEMQLGAHNGIELLYEMQSYADLEDIAVIVQTGNIHVQQPHFAKAIKELKIQKILYKPNTSIAQLVTAVARYSHQFV